MDEPRAIDMEGFGDRLREAISPEKPTAFAERINVASPTLFKYLKPPRNFSPSLEIVARIAAGAGCSIDYLATGRGEAPAPDTGLVKIPRYNVSLAAGAGKWNEGRVKIEDVPFTRGFILERLGRSSALGLSVLEARGDSMEPTIHDRAHVLVDELDTTLYDDIFAFLLDGEARIKRFQRQTSGLAIISDNSAYPVETISHEELSRVQVLGRALWVSQRL